MADHRIYPHGRFSKLLPGLWVVRGKINAPLHRNMVVLRLALGELLIHSAVALDEAGMKSLEALGRPAYAIVPNAQHQMDAPFYKSRYPKLLMLCPTEARPDLKRTIAIDDTVENVLPRIGFTLHAVPGSKAKELVYEYAFPSGDRILMVNDMIFGPNAMPDSFIGRIMKHLLVGSRGAYQIARIYRIRMVTDLPDVKKFIGTLSTIPRLRLVTISHGDPITTNPAQVLSAIAS